MLTAVYFLSLYQAQKVAGRHDAVVVSIHDRHFTPTLQPGFRGVLTLYFDYYDIDRDDVVENVDPFDLGHAIALRVWLKQHRKSPDSIILIIHCHAGISRSAAIAWWVHREFEVPLHTQYPAHYLNRHVLRVLNPAIDPPAIPEGTSLMKPTARVFDDDWPSLDADNKW
jgi:predicted protein tyrosine phosphatase